MTSTLSKKKTSRRRPVVSVVIPTYNPGTLLKRCLSSIPQDGTEIIVVDNGSRDMKVQEAAQMFPQARFLYLGGNTGFAHACNRGAELARGKVILFLNQDAEVIEEGFHRVLNFLLGDGRRGIAAGRIIYPDGRVQETIRRFLSYTNALFGRRTLLTRIFPNNPFTRRYLYQDIDLNKTQQVDVCTGMFLMVRAETFRRLSGFDEGFFFYVEDFDFCTRARTAGWEVWYVAHTSASHHMGENIPHLKRLYVKMHHYKGIYRYLIKHKRPGPILKALLWLGMGLAIVGHLSLYRLLR